MKYKIVKTDKKQPTRDIIPFDEFFCSNCNAMVTVDEMVDSDLPEGVLNWLNSHVKCCVYPDYHTYMSPLRHFKVSKPSGIDIEMGCGDKLHIDTDQPTVSTIFVQGKQVYPPTPVTNEGEVVRLLNAMIGGNWRFYANTSYNPGDYLRNNPDNKVNIIPIRKRVFIPNAWRTNGVHLPHHYGIYLRDD